MTTLEETIARINDQADWYLQNDDTHGSAEINNLRDEAIKRAEEEFAELEKNLREKCLAKLDSLPYSLETSGYRVVLGTADYSQLLKLADEIGAADLINPAKEG